MRRGGWYPLKSLVAGGWSYFVGQLLSRKQVSQKETCMAISIKSINDLVISNYHTIFLYCDNTILRHALYCDNCFLSQYRVLDILRHALYCYISISVRIYMI